MALERSKGKLRPGLPRSSDLHTVPAGEPDGNRDTGGRFEKGNTVGTRRGIRALIKRHLGRDGTNAETESVYRETTTLFGGFMKSMPTEADVVQDLAARQARASVFSARFAAQALEVGIFTDKGRQLLEMSIRFDQRAERLMVTALDVATKLAESERKQAPAVPWFTTTPTTRPADEPDDADDSHADDDAPESTPANVDGAT
jgi:hypothetical protein